MKKIREYHIESYWAAEAAKRKKKAELKEKVGNTVLFTVAFILCTAVAYGFAYQIFEII